jgi:pimeloyl-ACP methyl ester carboxylesterase
MRAESPQVVWTYSGADIIRSLRVPQLWAFAADDDIAPSAPSIARLAAIRREGTPIRMIVFPNTTHGIVRIARNDNGTRQNLGAVAPGYLQLLIDFAKGTTGLHYGDAEWQDGESGAGRP